MRSILAGVVALAAAGAANADVLNANPGPANNGGAANWAMFFDLEALTPGVVVTHLTTANTGVAGAAFTVEIFTFSGSGLGGPVASGPGSSNAGWTSLGIANATQGPAANGVSELIDIPDIVLGAGITGVAMKFIGVGPRYFGTGAPPLSVYADANLRLTTGDGRSAPFTTSGSFFSSRAMVGAVTYVVPAPASLALLGLGGLVAARRRR